MTWTYTPDFTTTRDQVRLLIGDTDTTDQQMQDDEIAYLATLYGSALRAASAACRSLQAKYARQADTAIDDIKVSSSQRAKAYGELAASLEAQATTAGAAVPIAFAGGVSVVDKLDRESDTDRTLPYFTRSTATTVASDSDA